MKPIRSLDQSPYRWIHLGPHTAPFLMLWFAILWRPVGDVAWWWLLPNAAIFVLAIYLLARPNFGRGSSATLGRLMRDLPWFRAFPVTVADVTAQRDLPAILARHGYSQLELDGARIASWSDLARELQAVFGPMRWPEDPRQNVLAVLRKAANSKPRQQVLVWRNAAHTQRNAPDLLVEFAAIWSPHALVSQHGFLVFVDLAAAPAPAEDRAHERGHADGPDRTDGPDGAETAARAALASAPDAAWWKPRPGELTR